MPPLLPPSLSPHVCVLGSPDLEELLVASSLPPLPQILQSFSPLPQVTTRTTTLNPVPHAFFPLRFSDLAEMEAACREGEDQRAARTIDWISSRVSQQSVKWVEDVEKAHGKEGQQHRTPWWDEVRMCAEADTVPVRTEGWNHPVAVILAVSTRASNPLQAIASLHSRPLDFPPWVDTTHLRYVLIVHPHGSPLSEEEVGALFNAVKKQYGLHAYLLRLTLPSPPPPPIQVMPSTPRLPPPTSDFTETSNSIQKSSLSNTLQLGERDMENTARFAREFVVMSLVPWMEKCVLEWNENFSSTRRLPSRLFSSTRRLFGSTGASTPSSLSSSPHSSSSPSIVSTQFRQNNTSTPASEALGQQRRLAEFATILGDLKLAINVWESLRKEGKGGSDVLPLLLSPSPSIPLYAAQALAAIQISSSECPPFAQLRALIYAVRWEAGIPARDFLSDVLEGERWLVRAAGNAEEPPCALLLGHAALLSSWKGARRRSALWYFLAADRLDKCGIKPLTMYFLRRAREQYLFKPEKSLSPSFWDSEGITAGQGQGFDGILPDIEHPLGRLLYSTRDIAGAARLFLGLLRGSSMYSPFLALPPLLNGSAKGAPKPATMDKVFLEDARTALIHLQSDAGDAQVYADLKAPLKFCVVRDTRVHLPHASGDDLLPEWQQREEDWRAFWRTRGPERLETWGRATVDEIFWLDVVLRNPLDAEVNLSKLTITVKERGMEGPASAKTFVDVEVIDDIILGARETRTIPISIKSSRPASLVVTHLTYDFLGLLPTTELLTSRGRRLQETALQRQGVVYAPGTIISVDVEAANHKLLIQFVDDGRLELYHGENKEMRLWISNVGTTDVDEIWMVAGANDDIWVIDNQDASDGAPASDVIRSSNCLASHEPHPVPLKSSILRPGESMELPIVLHAEQVNSRHLCLLFVFKDKSAPAFHSTRLARSYDVEPMLQVTTIAERDCSNENWYRVKVGLENVSSSCSIQLLRAMTLSPTWTCELVAPLTLPLIAPFQLGYLHFSATPWESAGNTRSTSDFVTRKLRDVLNGRTVEQSDPPALDILCSHLTQTLQSRTVLDPAMRAILHNGRRIAASRALESSHPHIPLALRRSIFPLYNPLSVDIVVFWEIPSQQRSGHLLVTGLTLGAAHGALQNAIEEAKGPKAKQGIYAETRREKKEILEAIRASEWNSEMNPLILNVQDGGKVAHDFARGSCEVPVIFKLQNYSLTHPSRYVLRLAPLTTPNLLPAQYSGRLTFRGMLMPSQLVTIRAKLRVSCPGIYSFGGWTLESEVCEPDAHQLWKTRQSYVQGPSPTDHSCVIVHDISTIP